MVGILANGSISKGFANSHGQRNWFHTHNFNLDWSFVETTDKAVKSSYAGQQWDSGTFRGIVETAKKKLEALRLPAITLDPGEYRVALSPGALWEILEVISWGGFGLKSQKTKVSPLLKLIDEVESLNPMFTLIENVQGGASPNFQGDGFIRPDTITLIEKGKHHSALISPRSSKEYNQPTNGANGHEMPNSLEVKTGDIPTADLLKRLNTGIDISNLWYLNYSDRVSCGITGMTRFATLWIENGEIKGPVNPLRFDDTVYRLLGENLLGLTKESSFLLSAGSYFERSTGCARLPGALINNMRFTL
jgi:predicted Zn-dependent protease